MTDCRECGEELFFPAIVDSDDKVVSVDTTHAKCSNVGCHLSQEFKDTIKVLAINYQEDIMADEEVEVQEPDEKDLKITELLSINKELREELTQHKKLFDLHRAVLEPYASKIMKDMVSKLEINIKEK